MDIDNNLYRFGSRLRELRQEQKLTQAQLAEKIGLSNNFIGMIERGVRNTTIDKMFLIIAALNTTPAKFFETM